MSRFSSILVANRGEIALRVMKTAKALGYRIIAVYSEADATAPHVQFADDAYCIGPAPVSDSYLAIDRVLEAAKATGAGAVHPGYGFLSENAAFSEACEEAGLVFIGPAADAITLMGNKAAAKRRMIEAGVPCVPGYEAEDQTIATLVSAANDIGYPIMVKAASGGGGRGMRLVRKAGDLPNAIETARSESENAFGSGELILEKAIMRPRHVEVQVFSDTHGNVIHLNERDCSVQRRHQKVVEEAPCPIMTEGLRAQMGAAAVEAARSINYRGAGTVEFLLDEGGAFYFLEMNTRLQVEHPVTEMITGLDLVAMQIKVAEGEELGITQEEVKIDGHAIEVRLYAEDPAQDFLPVTGRIELWQPAKGEGVRIDSGIVSGQEISPFYDAMIAKVIAWGETREAAGSRLVDALKKTRLFGTTTNKNFLIDILEKETFRTGQVTTAFIEEEFGTNGITSAELSQTEAAIASVLQFETSRRTARESSLGVNAELMNWSSSGHMEAHYKYSVGETCLDPVLVTPRPDKYEVRFEDRVTTVSIVHLGETSAKLAVNGRRTSAWFMVPEEGRIHLEVDGRTHALRNEFAVSGRSEDEAGGGRVTSPMHGTLLEVLKRPGDKVSKGDRLAILEAMKMQHEILAEIDGTVGEICGDAGAQVAAGDLILEINEEV